jgi:hypothetical protein
VLVQTASSVQEVCLSLMDAKVKLRIKDLLAVSGDIRQNIKSQLIGKRFTSTQEEGMDSLKGNSPKPKQARFDEVISVIPPPKVEKVFTV